MPSFNKNLELKKHTIFFSESFFFSEKKIQEMIPYDLNKLYRSASLLRPAACFHPEFADEGNPTKFKKSARWLPENKSFLLITHLRSKKKKINSRYSLISNFFHTIPIIELLEQSTGIAINKFLQIESIKNSYRIIDQFKKKLNIYQIEAKKKKNDRYIKETQKTNFVNSSKNQKPNLFQGLSLKNLLARFGVYSLESFVCLTYGQALEKPISMKLVPPIFLIQNQGKILLQDVKNRQSNFYPKVFQTNGVRPTKLFFENSSKKNADLFSMPYHISSLP